MKTKYCTQACKLEKYKMHDAICIYRRRDAGEFDNLVEKATTKERNRWIRKIKQLHKAHATPLCSCDELLEKINK